MIVIRPVVLGALERLNNRTDLVQSGDNRRKQVTYRAILATTIKGEV